MRFLCLHGRGTNADILEAQLAPLCLRLSQHTFDFVDAQTVSSAAPGISGLYPPPFLCWYKHGRPDEVTAALDHLCTIIDEDGPYDGLIGFSEGAALTASLLLCDEQAGRPARVRIAAMFNAVMPLLPDHLVETKHEAFHSLGEYIRGHEEHYRALLEAEGQQNDSLIYQTRCFAPKDPLRIPISTVHVIGNKDPFSPSSQLVSELCRSERSHVLRHEGGHTLPQAKDVLEQCAELIETGALFSSLDI
ncbi:hypothetical protein N7454_006548 [Penicillium verhagenii]|nr:hypothetical protein N7454_006548 [Penicillium verhagenii]